MKRLLIFLLAMVLCLCLIGFVQAQETTKEVTWVESARAEGYRVYVSTTSGQYQFGEGSPNLKATVGVGVTTATFNLPSDGKTYYGVVTAFNSTGESGPSNEDSVVMPLAIPDDPTGFQFVVNMSKNDDGTWSFTVSQLEFNR